VLPAGNQLNHLYLDDDQFAWAPEAKTPGQSIGSGQSQTVMLRMTVLGYVPNTATVTNCSFTSGCRCITKAGYPEGRCLLTGQC
jgi:hypothetical protein